MLLVEGDLELPEVLRNVVQRAVDLEQPARDTALSASSTPRAQDSWSS